MVKKHKRTYSGYMRRTSRIYLNDLNKGKRDKVTQSLQEYANMVRYYIVMFWSKQDFSNKLAAKATTDKGVARFNTTARMSQLACKQAKEIINSQIKKSDKTIPRFKNVSINLDSRFFLLDRGKGAFDWVLRLTSGFPKIIIPFNNTQHLLKFINNGWILGKSMRMGIDDRRLWIDIIFEKQRPETKKEGVVLGLDLGYRCPIATSRKELIGQELKAKIENIGKRRKSYHHFIQTEYNRLLKCVDLSHVLLLAVEQLKNVRKNKRGKFSRRSNRLLSFWLYAKVINRLRQICEEQGVCFKFKSPWKTSQRCPMCGNIDSKNRKKDKFCCTNCGFEENADTVASMNLEFLGLAGAYSLRSLQNNSEA